MIQVLMISEMIIMKKYHDNGVGDIDDDHDLIMLMLTIP